MPAKSKSQQRLFGMVHAYQKGEFHGSRGLRNRIAGLAKRVSKTDAKHFAQTPHTGLPEKTASEEYAFKGDRVTIFGNIRCRYAGKQATIIATNHDGADKSRQVSVFKTDDGHVFSGYTDAYVATNHTSKAAEKTAQATLRPDQAEAIAQYLALYAPPVDAMTRSVRRRSFLSRIVPGALIGATVGGLGVGGIGAYLAHRAAQGSGVAPHDAAEKIREAAVSCGLWGAGRGALAGAAAGVGLGVLDKIRGH